MSWKSLINKPNLYFTAIFVLFFLVTRLVFSPFEEINPDTVNWYFRSEQFVVALKSLDFQKTYQHYHPGVTLMWIMGFAIELIKQINPGASIINHENFVIFHTFSKLILIIVQLVLTLLILVILSKLIGYKKAYASIILFTFEPFFIGNSRFLHLDVLLTLFSFLALILWYFNFFQVRKHLSTELTDKPQVIQNRVLPNILVTVFTAAFIALAFMTKSIAIILLPFLLFSFICVELPWKQKFMHGFILLISMTIFLPVILPALLQDYSGVMSKIFSEAERVGGRKGHEQIYFGEETVDAGLGFYPVSLVIKLTPLTIISILAGLVLLLSNIYKILNKELYKEEKWKFILYLSFFYLGYILLMSIFSKKLDRYMLPAYPFIGVCTVYVWEYILSFKKFKKLFQIAIVGLVTGYFLSIYTTFPYYFVYANELIGGPVVANQLIAQKPFGIGIFLVRDYLFQLDTSYPTVGFIDTKPIREIYPNSKVFDIREYGPGSYEYVVLGINEDFTSEILNSQVSYKLAHTIKILGLDYWRIYAKER